MIASTLDIQSCEHGFACLRGYRDCRCLVSFTCLPWYQSTLINPFTKKCVIDSYMPWRGMRGQSSLCLRNQLLWRGQCAIKKNVHQDTISNILTTNWNKLFLNINWSIIKWLKSSIKSSLCFLHISDFWWGALEIPRE